ncbi:acyltransferase [Acinetobacter apis]|uniref:Peptidoglycan/LPS O-acetylase OafA/YrhL, contains acyltransferase and SGNH-hydrolase domains n=1 Tax=Acinetobacter apis TaxID=1229165 RepID=A0A217EFK6_9GAMM|nr:acyltransferase [Acinetobacter apis]SNQ29127.1 Peptidoglycan/LPS O-acetylase OafA/YrhL, contains acyltransferase and SGNH-hydrolase domains [Acinetobacter apis]
MAKLNAAESIRGLACVAVVLSHLSLTFYPYLHRFDRQDQAKGQFDYFIHHSPFAFLYSGTAAVFVFFVLSGFVLTYAIVKNNNIPRKVLEMTIKRYPRLAIPTFVSCLIAWAILAFSAIDSSLVNHWFQVYAKQNIGLQQALYEGSIGSFLFGSSAINWVLWTMQIEFFGSLLLFVLLILLNYHKLSFWMASLILPLIGLYLGERFFLGLLSFVIGCYIYLYAKQLSFKAGLVIFIVGLYCAGVHNTSHAYQWLYQILGYRSYDYVNFASGILIVYSILMTPQISQWLDKKPLVYLGKLSFSIYLLHMSVLYLICLPLFNFMQYLGWSYHIAVFSAVLVFFVLLLLISSVYSRYVDDFAVKCSHALAKGLLKSKV